MIRLHVRRCLATGVAAALLAGPGALAAWAAPVDLTILHTNDTHDHLEPFDTRHAKDVGGVARRATLFKRVRAEVKNVLALDGGDVFQGTPIFTFFEGEADYITMRQCGYDAVTVGNHDLDNGLANLIKQARHLAAPPLAATLVDRQGKPIFPPYRIAEVGGLKVALIGIMGQNAFEAIAVKRREGLVLKDPATVLKQLVPSLRKHADLVVVLSHTGHEEEVALAREVPGIDVIVGGHSHSKVERPVVVKSPDRETLVLQAFQWGEYVGRLDLTVDGGRVIKHDGRLIPVGSEIPADPTVAATVKKYADQLAEQMRQVVGRAAEAFPNSRKAEGDAPIGNLIADALRAFTRTEVGLMNSGGIRADLPKGDLTRGMVFSMLPFDNKLVTFEVKGELLQELLDYTASRAGRSGSLQVSGVSFVIAGGKATEVMVGDRPLDPARSYSVTTIDYVAQGNDGAEVFRKVGGVRDTGVLVRDAFMDYLKKNPLLSHPPGGRIRWKDPVRIRQ